MKVKILLVDDEAEVLEFLGRRLEKKGFEVFTASDGVHGLEAARAHLPDLILLDITMPNKDGMTMLRELKEDNVTAKIPVVMVTAKSASDAIFEGQKFGATDYIIKPVDFEQLLKYVRRYTPEF
jgi:DNA-binding response OmpR family regulator